ncbi:hypothetical protein [Streptomyces sp. NPDC057557]|uniref:hypothetical protein n=1 Tax=Streptomyces sp. NPDC057557 TaxID=3346167 RepID=UPI00369D03F6
MSVSTNLLPANTAGIETDASGWTAGANTTVARNTTRFYTGAASLGMTATASGSVTATVSARVAVTAGTEYTAYAYFANIAAAAGRVATVRVDWYAAVSGGTALSSATSAGATLANATTWSTPPPILIATAPTGAAYASVTITVTGMAAGSVVVADAIAFGPPSQVVGNLLTYNAQSVEVDASGWAAQTNATVGRTSTLSYEGWYVLQMTAVAAGAMESRQAVTVPVTEGVEYTAHAWIQPSTTGLECKIQILWYTASGVGIGARFSQSWVLAASTWTRCSVIGTAPAGAAFARIAISPVATAAGQTWYSDVMALRPTPIAPGSLIGYNAQSMEVDASDWAAVSGCTVARSTDYAWDGAASLRIDATGTGDAVFGLVPRVAVMPRQAYQVAPYLRLGVGAATRYFVMSFSWYDTAGTLIRTVDMRWTLTGSGGGWYTPTTSAVAPTGAASMGLAMRLVALPVGEPAYLDAVGLTPGGMAAIADPVPDTYGASIALQGLTTTGYSYWGLWRMASDGTMTAVRGSSGDLSQVGITGDVAVVEDYEAPLGVPVTYYLKTWTGTAYRAIVSEPIVIPEPPPAAIVMKDPGLPARQTAAVVAKGGQPAWTRKARQGVNPVRGRVRPIVISDVRTSREGTMTLVTETAEELAAMWWLLETGNVLLLQWPSLWGERDAYVTVGDVTEDSVVEYAEYSDRTWTLPLTEVDRPIGGSTGSAGRTWQTVNDTNTDWLDVATGATSWLDVYTGVKGG